MRRDDDWGFLRSANLVARDGEKMVHPAVAVRVALGPQKLDRRQLSLLAASYLARLGARQDCVLHSIA